MVLGRCRFKNGVLHSGSIRLLGLVERFSSKTTVKPRYIADISLEILFNA